MGSARGKFVIFVVCMDVSLVLTLYIKKMDKDQTYGSRPTYKVTVDNTGTDLLVCSTSTLFESNLLNRVNQLQLWQLFQVIIAFASIAVFLHAKS